MNPWLRANLDQFNPETLALVPVNLQEEYTRIMKELAHTRVIAGLALERMYSVEVTRTAFFSHLIEGTAYEAEAADMGPNVIELAKYRADPDPPPLAA